jgi:hypothetical protein
MLGFLHFMIATVLGALISAKVVRETSMFLILGTAPLYGSVALVAAANWGLDKFPSMILLAILSVGLFFVKSEKPRWDTLKAWQAWVLGGLCLIVVVFTHHHNVNILDTDRYLHDAHIVAFSRGVYPPVNPFFPHLAMNGHFGRDLMMSVLTTPGADPVIVTWWVTPFIQVGTFLTLFASTLVFSGSATRGLLVASMVFLGMDCGFRVGLIDTFDGSNALAHPWLILLVYLMVRIMETPRWQNWLVAGVALGTYQLVYMTSFALLLPTGLILFLVKCRDKKAWAGLVLTGILAMGLAVTEGGAFTDMARRGLDPELSKAVQNQGLRVSIKFPKDNLFQVMALTSDYQRTSVAYKTSLFKGLYSPPTKQGYISIFDPDFLTTHWLPLYLCPLALWYCRRSALALGYWIFGCLSYLVPGLVDFGPIFEYEYFRWEYTAAIGFAAALGYALGEFLEECPIKLKRGESVKLEFGPGSAKYLAALAVLVASLLAGEKLLNDAVIAAQKDGHRWFCSSAEYRLSEPEFRLTKDDLETAAWLRQRTDPNSRILTNRLEQRPYGMWPDTTIATLSGSFPAGHAFPPRSQVTPHGNPAFLPNTLFTAFWATGDWSVLTDSRVSWVVADTSRLSPDVVKKLEQVEHKWFGDRLVAKVPPTPVLDKDPQVDVLTVVPPEGELRIGRRYPLTVGYKNEGEVAAIVLKFDQPEVQPLSFFAQTGEHLDEWSLVTPHDEGTYQVTLLDAQEKELASFSINVDFLERLSQLKLRFEYPQFKTRSLYRLKGTVEGPTVQSEGELDLYYRFKRPDGEYAWEVDSIYQSVDLNLPENNELELEVFTPELPGAYELEFWFFDRFSGRSIKSDSSVQLSVDN